MLHLFQSKFGESAEVSSWSAEGDTLGSCCSSSPQVKLYTPFENGVDDLVFSGC
jgi:hypothetical protein